MAEAFEPSSNTVRGLVRGAEERGVRPAVEATLTGTALEAFTDPTARRWWPGSAYNQIAAGLIRAVGVEEYENICFHTAQRTFGPIVAPMVKVTLALVGSTPGSLLSKLSLLASVAIRGPVFTWTSTGKDSGLLNIKYLGPTVPISTIHAWRATIRYACELTKPGKIVKSEAIENNQTFVFEVKW